MSGIMSLINALMSGLVRGLLYPFTAMHPMVGLTTISVIAAVLMLLAYKATSNQTAIDAVKRKITAGLFEIRLFNDDVVAILRAQNSILRHNLTYMRLNLVPMLWMIVPFVLVVAQLQFQYGYEGLRAGEPTLLTVTLSDDAVGNPERPAVELDLPEGLRLDSDSVWAAPLREVTWRLVAERPGSFEVGVRVAGETHAKTVEVSDVVVTRSPWRLRAGFLNQLLYPAESPLPADAAVEAIEIAYPDREVGLFGFETHWLIVFFILTIVIAFALKGRFGVTI